jgi:5-methylcytosine-specific restriction endonuclease McrA
MRFVKSSAFKNVIKHCKECGTLLQLNNSRDVERKNYCGHSCRGKVNGRNSNMNLLWIKNNTPEVNAKKAHYGKNHPKWITDRSKVKSRARPEMNSWRNFIFNSDKFTCKHCGVIGGKLHAHHKAPYSLFFKLRWELNNGITLCESCHKQLHKTAVELFGGLTSKKYRGERFANSQ